MARERRNWTSLEDELLEQAVERARSDSQTLQWNTIAANVPGRTNKDYRKRYYYKVSATVNKGTWTKAEDERLRNAIQNCGLKWTRVSAEVGTRSADQCSKRWNNTLDPAIDQSAWSPQDTKILLRCVGQQGHNWKTIVAGHFPNRTALSARNQYNYICRRSGANSQSSTPSSNQSHSSSQPRTRSNMQPVRLGFNYQRQSSNETNLGSDDEESDFNNDISSDEEGSEELMPNHKPLQGDYINLVNHAASDGSQIEPLMELDPMYPTGSPHELPQYPSLDELLFDKSTLAAGEAQTDLQFGPFQGITDQSHPGIPSLKHPFTLAEVAEVPNTTTGRTGNYTRKKTVTIRSTCSRAEVRRLMQATADELQHIDFSVTSRESRLSSGSRPARGEGAKDVVITASCPSNEVGRLMEMASDVLGSCQGSNFGRDPHLLRLKGGSLQTIRKSGVKNADQNAGASKCSTSRCMSPADGAICSVSTQYAILRRPGPKPQFISGGTE
ncbi:MAG: hypothetical protein Q9198_001434 [Flavoplaca austrocitrina]